MKKKVAEIKDAPYGVGDISCEPKNEEITKAVREKDFDRSSFQGDREELNSEWNRDVKNSKEYYNLQKEFSTNFER